jgi:prevent-host-death family protein
MSTKTIAAAKFRNNFSSTLDAIGDDDVLIVTRRGKKERVVIDIDKFEDLLAANNPKYLKEIEKSRQQFKDGEFFTMEEVFGNL